MRRGSSIIVLSQPKTHMQIRHFRTTSISLLERLATPPPSPGPNSIQKDRGANKVYASADEAVADIKSGSVLLSAGFGVCGTAG
jgi:3-oxoacid CoA-transferase